MSHSAAMWQFLTVFGKQRNSVVEGRMQTMTLRNSLIIFHWDLLTISKIYHQTDTVYFE